MLLREVSAPKTHSPAELGISTVYRTDSPDKYYKDKAIWGVGKYFSLTKTDSERINDGGEIKAYHLPDMLRLMEFDLTWRTDREKSNADYERIHNLIKHKPPQGVDGYVIRSHSMQYGYSQVLIFPHAVHQVKEE